MRIVPRLNMKLHLCLTCFLGLIAASAHTQVLNRAYINAGYGYQNHIETGIYVHLYNHFSLGVNAGHSKVKVGPSYHIPGLLTGRNRRLSNTYQTINLMAGVTTNMNGPCNFSFMAGPAWMDAVVRSNFELVKNEYNNGEHVEHTVTNSSTIGMAMRVDMAIELVPACGLNLGVQQGFNSVYNDLSIVLGLNIGIIGGITLVLTNCRSEGCHNFHLSS